MAMNLPDGRSGQLLALALTALVLAVVWFGLAAPLLDWHAGRAEDIAARATLARRMAEVAGTLPELRRRAVRAAEAAPQLRQGVGALIGGDTDAIAAADLQQRVQEMAARTGASLSSTETLPAVQVGGYRRIELRVSTSISWAVLMQMLAAIAQATPHMLVDDLQLHRQRLVTPPPDPPLEASFTVLAFRAATEPRPAGSRPP